MFNQHLKSRLHCQPVLRNRPALPGGTATPALRGPSLYCQIPTQHCHNSQIPSPSETDVHSFTLVALHQCGTPDIRASEQSIHGSRGEVYARVAVLWK
jgi:hypothetical protein